MCIISLTTRKSEREFWEKPTEATATNVLQQFFYSGCGPNYLGYRFPDQQLQKDGTWRPLGDGSFRFWRVPEDQIPRLRWKPVFEQLKGLPRGVVARQATSVPFIAVDLDRHSATILEKDHIIRVIKTGRLLTRHFPQFRWSSVEVNPRNGSAKFFGGTGKPISIELAVKLGEKIHALLIEHGCGLPSKKGVPELEVFPFNCIQVGLPMRTDKTTIISSGVLPKCLRIRQKRSGEGRERFETYSALAYLGAIRNGSHYDELTLYKELKTACAKMPYEPAKPTLPPVIWENFASKSCEMPSKVGQAASNPSFEVRETLGDYLNNPNSYERQQGALLELCRRIGRVATFEEALAFIKTNGLFTGEWQENAARREARVKYLLARIAKTFNPAKRRNRGMESPIVFGKYDNWARAYAGTIRGKTGRYVDEFGEVVEWRSRLRVDWQFVSAMLSIIEHALVIDPNDDGSFPEHRAETMWRSWQAAGKITINWNSNKWEAVRDWLEEKGIIKITDRQWRYDHGQGQAMKWAVTDDFDRLHIWWKRNKQPSVNDAVILMDFLLRKNREAPPPLNSYPHYQTDKRGLASVAWRSRPPP